MYNNIIIYSFIKIRQRILMGTKSKAEQRELFHKQHLKDNTNKKPKNRH